MDKGEMIAGLIEQAKTFRFCSPEDDPAEQTAVTIGYRDLIIKFQRWAGPLLKNDAAQHLGAIQVEYDDIYSVYSASSELEALLPDIEAAIQQLKGAISSSKRTAGKAKPLPAPVCSVIGNVIGGYVYSHRRLDRMFYEAGAAGEVPLGNCVDKCQSWLRRMHEDVADPAAVLGKVIEDFMEVDDVLRADLQEPGRKSIQDILAKHGLAYHTGGLILGATNALPSRSLIHMLQARDLAEVDKEFERSLVNIQSDPPAAIAAACSILESLFKIYIEDHAGVLQLPKDQTLKPLWAIASKHLGFDPAVVVDEDLKKVLSGMTSVVDGIGSLRTHRSTAHGQGRRPYRIEPRHARLAVHAAHTLVAFFLETWDTRTRKAANGN